MTTPTPSTPDPQQPIVAKIVLPEFVREEPDSPLFPILFSFFLVLVFTCIYVFMPDSPQEKRPRGFPVRVVDGPEIQELRSRIEALEKRLEGSEGKEYVFGNNTRASCGKGGA